MGTNGVGRLTSLTDQAGSGTYTYDVMGRVKTETRVINGVSRTITYDYNFDGSLSALHYPSNRVVNYTVNGGSRVTSASDGNGTQYVVNATSYPPGAEYQRSMPGIYFRTDMNPRLQVSGFYSDNGQTTSFFMNKSYTYGPVHQNNGNVVSIINNKDSNRTQSFTYDPLNRITAGWTTANTGTLSWGENYTIDAWGNLQMNPMGGKAHGGYLPNASTAQNQMTGMGYDAAGNMTQYTAPNQYYYDPENRIQLAGGMTYTYDADGNRVKKATGSTGTLYWYSSVGVIAETDLTGATKSEYVFFGGKRVARIDAPANSLHYYLSDHLNSTSMIVSASGVPEEESDYSPFGSEYVVTAGPNHYKFTGKERDSETQLDYFGARYYSNGLARFITPDWASKPTGVPYAEIADPQSLNLYSYVRNIPTSRFDPDGHCSAPAVGKGQVGICVDLYIQSRILPKVAPGIGLGDGRGTTPNDPTKSYRQEIQLVVTPGAAPKKVKDDGGTSVAITVLPLPAPVVMPISGKGTSDTKVSDTQVDKNGTEHFSISSTGINGLAYLPGAPQDTIKTDINFVVTADGKVGLDPGGERTAYPSIEIYSYGADGTVKQIYQKTESGNVDDLKHENQPIPQVAPK